MYHRWSLAHRPSSQARPTSGTPQAEQHDEWTEGRRYLGLDILARSRITLTPATQEVTPDNDLQALSA
jgi:putative transposase